MSGEENSCVEINFSEKPVNIHFSKMCKVYHCPFGQLGQTCSGPSHLKKRLVPNSGTCWQCYWTSVCLFKMDVLRLKLEQSECKTNCSYTSGKFRGNAPKRRELKVFLYNNCALTMHNNCAVCVPICSLYRLGIKGNSLLEYAIFKCKREANKITWKWYSRGFSVVYKELRFFRETVSFSLIPTLYT